MKNKALSMSLIFVSVIMLATVASSVQVTKIGTGYNPAISGNMVTWSDNNGSIHVYDLTSHKDTTINSSNSSNPAIYGNKIVWHDDNSSTPRLTVYDIPSGARSYITQNVDSTSIPKIYGNRIVWGSNGNVYLRDISTSTQTQIVVGIYSNIPDIYDTKVVYSNSDGHICVYDITTKETETIYSDYEELEDPHIYGNKVIWSNFFTAMGFIQMCDLATDNTIAVTSDVAWSGNQQMGDDTGTHTAIYGDKIVYAKISHDDFGDVGVYVYNISTGQSTPVITYPVPLYTAGVDSTPDIYDNTVVWGTGDDIYVCNLTANTEPSLANFTSNVTSGYMPLSVSFTDTSKGTPISWLWDFGDGTNSTEQNPTHDYYAVGNYIVNLTVREFNSTYSKYGTISVSKNMTVVANFSTNVSKGYAPLTVQFTDLSENAQFWTWDFGDGTFDSISATQQNPTHTYYKAGNFTVGLSATNNYGSIDYKSTTITVLEKPVPILPTADFYSNLVSGFAPLDVQFTDSSKNATGWKWDFGDGTNSNEQNPEHTYFLAGTYLVSLTVNNVNGTALKSSTIAVIYKSGLSSGSSSGGGSSSNSGSGGGGGSSPEPQSNVEVKEISQVFITNGSPVKFDFSQKVTPVEKISFDAKKTVGKTSTIVELLKAKSTLVTGLPSNELYKYLNIWVGNSGFATEKNIGNAVVTFKVTKSWVQDKDIDKSSITLNRYSDKTWNQLPTSLSSEDDNYLYFSAQTPSFSSFAITGKITAVGTVQPANGKTVTANVNTTQTETNTENTTASTEMKTEQTTNTNTSEKGSTKAPGFETFFGIVSLLAVFLHKRR